MDTATAGTPAVLSSGLSLMSATDAVAARRPVPYRLEDIAPTTGLVVTGLDTWSYGAVALITSPEQVTLFNYGELTATGETRVITSPVISQIQPTGIGGDLLLNYHNYWFWGSGGLGILNFDDEGWNNPLVGEVRAYAVLETATTSYTYDDWWNRFFGLAEPPGVLITDEVLSGPPNGTNSHTDLLSQPPIGLQTIWDDNWQAQVYGASRHYLFHMVDDHQWDEWEPVADFAHNNQITTMEVYGDWMFLGVESATPDGAAVWYSNLSDLHKWTVLEYEGSEDVMYVKDIDWGYNRGFFTTDKGVFQLDWDSLAVVAHHPYDDLSGITQDYRGNTFLSSPNGLRMLRPQPIAYLQWLGAGRARITVEWISPMYGDLEGRCTIGDATAVSVTAINTYNCTETYSGDGQVGVLCEYGNPIGKNVGFTAEVQNIVDAAQIECFVTADEYSYGQVPVEIPEQHLFYLPLVFINN
ncbi:hypothetical protein KKB83_05515 [Patescibacteria group bacterium]|nr:hypothetical protein [Patescibacteria group bacterium]